VNWKKVRRMKGVLMNKRGSILGVLLLTFCFGVFADEGGSRYWGKLDSAADESLVVPADMRGVAKTGKGEQPLPEDSGAVSLKGMLLAAASASAVPVHRDPLLRGRALTTDMEVKYPSGKYIPRVVQNKSWGVGEQLVFHRRLRLL
jgi:hypothetical protein